MKVRTSERMIHDEPGAEERFLRGVRKAVKMPPKPFTPSALAKAINPLQGHWSDCGVHNGPAYPPRPSARWTHAEGLALYNQALILTTTLLSSRTLSTRVHDASRFETSESQIPMTRASSR